MSVNTHLDHVVKIREDHFHMVRTLAKSGEAIIKSLTPEKAHAWHMASALSSEAGELFDAFKRWIIYEKEIDRANLLEELGDIYFYLNAIHELSGITPEMAMGQNLIKLSERYGKALKYSNEAAQLRQDKVNDEQRRIEQEAADLAEQTKATKQKEEFDKSKVTFDDQQMNRAQAQDVKRVSPPFITLPPPVIVTDREQI